MILFGNLSITSGSGYALPELSKCNGIGYPSGAVDGAYSILN